MYIVSVWWFLIISIVVLFQNSMNNSEIESELYVLGCFIALRAELGPIADNVAAPLRLLSRVQVKRK